MFQIEEELRKLPKKPGVYLMHDQADTIIYVGKAINLHNRVRSYFREKIGRGPWIDKMVSQIARFEYIVTDTELEALVLENNLINFFITDDGCGFISKTTKDINIENSTSLGLKGMESRAIILNGTLDIHSDEETGTHIKLVVPVEANNKDW